MAGDWLKIEAVTPDKPEVFEIATLCKVTPDDAFGKVFRVWRLFDQQTENGNASNVTWAYLDHVVGVTGFAQAMFNVGWLAGGDDGKSGVTLPNFDRHNGKTAKARALTAKRVATHKERSANAKVTQTPLPREEKRRDTTPIAPSGPFLRFWGAWPKGERKRSQGKCWELWRRKDFDLQAEVILRHVEVLKASDSWQRGFVPAPLAYLNQRQWEGADLEQPPSKVAMP